MFKNNSTDLALVINFAENYHNHFREVNKIVARDHEHPLKVSLVGGEFKQDSGEILEQYLGELEILNTWNAFNTLKHTVMESLTDKGKADLLDKILDTWNRNFLTSWDSCLEYEMTRALNTKHKAKCQQLLGVYNFTSREITEQNMNIVKLSKKVVPLVSFTRKKKDTRIKEECLNYAKKYRLYIVKEASVITEEGQEWLEKAAAIAKN